MTRCIYVISMEDGPVKIGIASDVRNRLHQLRVSSAFHLRLEYSAMVNGPAPRLEAKVHQSLATSRMRGEWFNVAAVTAIEVIVNSATELGLELLPPSTSRIRAKSNSGRPLTFPIKKVIGLDAEMASRISAFEESSMSESFSDAFRGLLDSALLERGIA